MELLHEHGFDRDEIGRRLAEYEVALTRHMTHILPTRQITTLPGALEAVHTLRGRHEVVLGIVTGNLPATAHLKLRAAGFDPAWFPVGAYGSEAVERDDLPPLALARAIAHAGRTIAPHEVWVVGDTVADIQCARALGARVVAVATGFSTREELIAAQPDVLLDDLTMLLEVLSFK
jgi:phosphoglycolate phosphatase-like HAD superfamily hydrolase